MCENDCGSKAIFVTFNKESRSITKVCPHCYYLHPKWYAHTVYEIPTGEIKLAKENY